MAALASVIAVGGLVGGAGVASAKKPVLDGTLSCGTTGTTTITPGIVLTTAQLPAPKHKDKKPTYLTNGGGNSCTGMTVAGTQPTTFTLTSKAKGTSRVLVNPGAACDATGRVAKTTIVFNTGDKMKVDLTSELSNYAYNTTTHVSTQFPACGGDLTTALTFASDHGNDRIETRSHGISKGKAYKSKAVTSRSVTTVTLAEELGLSQTTNGVTSLSGDPALGTLTIG